jgi:hypothetical protein
MAGAAVMIAMMGQATTGHVPSHAMSLPTAHHSMAAPPPSVAAATVDHSPGLAILLTVLFGGAAVFFLLLVMRRRTSTTTRRSAPALRLPIRAEHGLEALGAAIMAMMFATMA